MLQYNDGENVCISQSASVRNYRLEFGEFADFNVNHCNALIIKQLILFLYNYYLCKKLMLNRKNILQVVIIKI